MQLNAKLIRHFLRAKYRSSGGVSVLDVPIVDVPIESGANGNNKYTTSGGDSSGVCSGQNIYRVPVRLHTRAEVLQQCLGNYAIRSTWKTAPLDG